MQKDVSHAVEIANVYVYVNCIQTLKTSRTTLSSKEQQVTTSTKRKDLHAFTNSQEVEENPKCGVALASAFGSRGCDLVDDFLW